MEVLVNTAVSQGPLFTPPERPDLLTGLECCPIFLQDLGRGGLKTKSQKLAALTDDIGPALIQAHIFSAHGRGFTPPAGCVSEESKNPLIPHVQYKLWKIP